MKKSALLITTFLMLATIAVAQKDFSDMDRIRDAVAEKMREEMKGWKCHDIEPLTFGDAPPPDELRILQWVSDTRDVRVVLHRHPSAQEASMSLRQFAGSSRVRGHVHGLADEAYLHGGRNTI